MDRSLAIYFLSLAAIFGNIMHVVRKDFFFLLLQVMAIAVNTLVAFMLVDQGYGLVGVALASIVAYGSYYCVLVVSAMRQFRARLSVIFIQMALHLLPAALMFLILYGTGGLFEIVFWDLENLDLSFRTVGYISSCLCVYGMALGLWLLGDRELKTVFRRAKGVS